MSQKPYVIGICGGTCSGKSTLADNLDKIFSKKYNVFVFHMDDYYKEIYIKTIAPITRKEYPEHNHPDAIDVDILYNDFMGAISSIESDIVIIEGLFSFYFDQLREQLDLKVFVDLKSDERMYRRIKRWINDQTLDEIAIRYLDTVRYRHDEFVEPTRWYADVVINGTLDTNLGISMLVSYIEKQLQ
ncbi:MAG: AAA family ATPase [Clostridiales bacterium]|jgi:uridine kinase|nr:AAA family ATPase [Clostridiales bacterium]